MLTQKDLLEILNDWSFWDGKKPEAFVPRTLRLPKQLVHDIALIIQGVRRGGKSTLMTQLPAHYHLNLEHCYFCNFEDPRLLNQLDHTLLSDIVTLAKTRSGTQPCYFFFDEIQNVADWEKWLHTQLERPKNKYFILTGSNATLLSGELATTLTGRHITLELFPFCFAEYLQVFPKNDIKDYLSAGGFPKALFYPEPNKLLQEYFNDIILRDVLRRVRARSPDSIKQVVKMAFESCGAELSYRKIAAVTDLSVETVQLYLEACEQAYLLFTCPYFAFSEKKRLSQHKKFYPIDPGLRAAVTTKISEDFGKHLEMLVYLRLKQRYENVYYWKNEHSEVDFVVLHQQTITPYQVTWDDMKPRHQHALDAFYAAYPQASEFVLINKHNASEFI
ncbi:MAG: ATP-binding protein [Legionellales bacterium]|jgi:hypothetical protein